MAMLFRQALHIEAVIGVLVQIVSLE